LNAGFQVDVTTPTSSSAFIGSLESGAYDCVLAGYIARDADPANYLDALLHSKNVPRPTTNEQQSGHQYNNSRLSSAALDALLADFRADRTSDALARIYQFLRETVALIPLTHGRAIVVHRWNVKGLKPSICSLWDLAKVTKK
jgi:ABC-type transport system substrate-binding protein